MTKLSRQEETVIGLMSRAVQRVSKDPSDSSKTIEVLAGTSVMIYALYKEGPIKEEDYTRAGRETLNSLIKLYGPIEGERKFRDSYAKGYRIPWS